MKYCKLTGTGVTISRVTLGTMTFGPQWGVSEEESFKMINYAIENGINSIDTADLYNKGITETILGKALKGRRDELVLASKVYHFIGGNELKDKGLNRWHLIKGVEDSLIRLQTDHLDILYFHQPDYNTPLEESLAAADQLVRQGKTMYIGMSNYASWQLCEALWIADKRNFHPPVVTQVVYNLITRGIEEELLPFIREHGIGLLVYNPLAGGLLTGKYDVSNPPPDNTRLGKIEDYNKRYWQKIYLEAVEDIKKIAKEAGKKPIALAYQWLISQPEVDSVIMGASKLSQLKENLTLLDGKLDDEILKACDEIWNKLRGQYFRYNR
ncbi:MAG TPA: aldo/keto reductase [Candidatus Atribacteria bacterium]|nr:aldo/keto reductase [Candidatus Atribacteria bacterium]